MTCYMDMNEIYVLALADTCISTQETRSFTLATSNLHKSY